MHSELARQGEITPYESLDKALRMHADGTRACLGKNSVGLYTLGSLAIGDVDLTSDVDFVIVTADELQGEAVHRVQAWHTELMSRDAAWFRRLEYSYFPKPRLRELSPPYDAAGLDDRSEGRLLWYFCNGHSEIERSGHDNTLVTRWTLRNRSRTVAGPEPASFAPVITPHALRGEIKNSLIGWSRLMTEHPARLDDRFHQVFMVLNACRALQELHEGRVTSKRQGMQWAKRHLEPEWRSLIDFCWHERQDTGIHVSQPADRQAWHRTVAFVAHAATLAQQYQLR